MFFSVHHLLLDLFIAVHRIIMRDVDLWVFISILPLEVDPSLVVVHLDALREIVNYPLYHLRSLLLKRIVLQGQYS